MLIRDLGILAYRPAWLLQQQAHADVLAGGQEQLLLLEHPPVITFGRRPSGGKNLLASAEQLAAMGVELVPSDRGGDITFHGPGQVVAYPIIRLLDHRLSVGTFVHLLESIVVQTLARIGIVGRRDPSAIGVWVDGTHAGKICALGVRIGKGVSMHGIALNVTTDLSFFNLIIPCGLRERSVTSVKQQLGDLTPTVSQVKAILAEEMVAAFDLAR